MPKPLTLSPDILNAALEGLQTQRQRIEDHIAAIRRTLGSGAKAMTVGAAAPTRNRTISAAGKARIAETQRQRWAAFREEHGTAPAKRPAKAAASRATRATPKKRRLSPEGRRRIIEATKKRWAAVRARQAAKK